MTAPVEKRHRELALKADLAASGITTLLGSMLENEWVESGAPWQGSTRARLTTSAQALADCEAATAHRAWNEGCESGLACAKDSCLSPRNPYPDPENKP